jgi:hypothetical protein
MKGKVLPDEVTLDNPKSEILQVRSDETSTLRAAKSRWTTHMLSRYAIPEQTSTVILSSVVIPASDLKTIGDGKGAITTFKRSKQTCNAAIVRKVMKKMTRTTIKNKR